MAHNTMEGRDLYLRYQGPKHDVVRELRVWDGVKCFNEELINSALQDPPVLVSLSNEADYIAYRKSK